jgi:hypothetical protein
MVAREALARRVGVRLLAVGAVTFAITLVAAPAGANNGKAVGHSFNHHNVSGESANVSGPYDGNSDGSPSGNGNGDGNATGEPCAGCVGNADDKNPPGQLPDGSDDNNGYECDGNNGIAKTNPAHTGCVTTTTEAPTTTTVGPTTTTAGATTTTAAPTTTVTAGETPTTALVLGVTVTRPTPTTVKTEVLGAQLARTGANVLTMLRWAAVVLMLGGLCLAFGKREAVAMNVRRWRG